MGKFKQFIDVNRFWNSLLSDILTHGENVPSRNGNTKEIFGWSGTIMHPEKCFLTQSSRHLSAGYAAAELLWYLCRSDRSEWLTPYAPQYKNFAQEDGSVYGAYGARWARARTGMNDQLIDCYDLLCRDATSRQAVVTHWYPADAHMACHTPKRDIPCTLSFQFLVRDGKLHMHVNMRSNDAWLGTPYDVFCFCTIQVLMASALGYAVGQYNHSVASMHLYEKDWTKARESIDNAEDWMGGREIGLYPGQSIAKQFIIGSYAFRERIEHVKKCIESYPEYEPMDDDPWLHDLFWCMKGKLYKEQRPRVVSEIVRTDLATNSTY